MFTEIYRIDGPWVGRLAISARPRGGDWLDEELSAWRRAGIDVIVSLLEPNEAADLDLSHERTSSEAHGIEFFSLPIVDRGAPAPGADVQPLIGELDRRLSCGENIVVHCRQGIGRAALLAIALLIERGHKPSDAIALVSVARRAPVPETADQRAWLESFAAALVRRV